MYKEPSVGTLYYSFSCNRTSSEQGKFGFHRDIIPCVAGNCIVIALTCDVEVWPIVNVIGVT